MLERVLQKTGNPTAKEMNVIESRNHSYYNDIHSVKDENPYSAKRSRRGEDTKIQTKSAAQLFRERYFDIKI